MNNSIFSVLVIGDNPDEQMMSFDIGQDLEEPYILYKYYRVVFRGFLFTKRIKRAACVVKNTCILLINYDFLGP